MVIYSSGDKGYGGLSRFSKCRGERLYIFYNVAMLNTDKKIKVIVFDDDILLGNNRLYMEQ